MPPKVLIEVRDVSRRDASSGHPILDRVSMCVSSGDRIGLVGPTGSGKSTLLRAIARLDPLHSGEILFRGQFVHGDAIPSYRRQVVYLPQRPSFVAGTVRHNLQFAFHLAAHATQFELAEAIEWLDRLTRQATKILDQSVDTLSGGQQQMVALVRALLLKPLVLLLDEPSASLDAASTQEFEQSVSTWLHTGGGQGESQCAMIWTSHDVKQVQRMTTRAANMRAGQLTWGTSS